MEDSKLIWKFEGSAITFSGSSMVLLLRETHRFERIGELKDKDHVVEIFYHSGEPWAPFKLFFDGSYVEEYFDWEDAIRGMKYTLESERSDPEMRLWD